MEGEGVNARATLSLRLPHVIKEVFSLCSSWAGIVLDLDIQLTDLFIYLETTIFGRVLCPCGCLDKGTLAVHTHVYIYIVFHTLYLCMYL